MSEQFEPLPETLEPAGELPEIAVGESLAKAREARGLSAEDVASALKLGARQVLALEAGDWGALPGNTFIRGFVRNYARHLEIDVTPLMSALDTVLKKPEDTLKISVQSASMPARGGSALFHKNRLALVWLVAIALSVIAGVALIAGNASSLVSFGREALMAVGLKKTDLANESAASSPASAQEALLPPGETPQQVLHPQALPPVNSVPAPAAVPLPTPVAAPSAALPAAVMPAAVPQAPAAPPISTGLHIVFKADSLLEVRDAHQKILFFQRRVRGGAVQDFSFDAPLTVTLGNAAGAQVFWKGKEIDLAPYIKGNGARLVLE